MEGRVRVNGGARRRSVGAMGSGSRARSRGFKPRDNFAVEESHRVSGSPPGDVSSVRRDGCGSDDSRFVGEVPRVQRRA